MERLRDRRRLVGGAVAAVVLVVACNRGTGASPEASATGVLQPGHRVANACEEAVLTLHQHSGLDNEFEQLELAVYETCTFTEFSAFNGKVTERYRYPGDGSSTVQANCGSPDAPYKGSKLCVSVEE